MVSSEAASSQTQPAIPTRSAVLIGASTVGTAAGLFALAAVQVHPDLAVLLFASVLVLIGIGVPLIEVPRAVIARYGRVVVLVLLTATVIGWWNPWDLFIVRLALWHPTIFGLAIIYVLGAIVERRLRKGWASELSKCLLGVLAAVLMLGGMVVAYLDPHGTFVSSTEVESGRADLHQSGPKCYGFNYFHRQGSGLLLRERMLPGECNGIAALTD